ncbi:Afi1p KNAG_0B04120 [Huiozyma naganishii CBS 8797]|uniref:Arf3-interacting protein 1 N-terminal domain-containing protein n=1 Tax=Huiozyma naganishii (strain ATCC MYA-139 / BCRC 22969 / CBS 8797 / KCTC 17520 / NBRC 10181 / NCYC 3082 / Yp74L-3) TaxID=1071383 RepID=J7RH31_HUIN7|nr:hypothetical protein KNAG_0B04120 [Kazachstania naganishii CBS 8797]CCK68848.1 hypothetical protein KNAG_0B04120 [Kazachstania naganishii CBS 8797]
MNSQYRERNISCILAAEFDNKLGPVVRHQYPEEINLGSLSGDEKFPDSGTIFDPTNHIANLMIPENSERRQLIPDFIVFIMYLHKSNYSYRLLPEVYDDCSTETTECLYFLSIHCAIPDEQNSRGASIKSVAIGTTLRNFILFKPLLIIFLDFYMKRENYKIELRILKEFFDLLNSVDLSLVETIHNDIAFQTMVHSLDNEDIVSEIFDNQKSNVLKETLQISEIPKQDKYGNSINFHNNFISYQFDTFTTEKLPPIFTKIPLQANLKLWSGIETDIDYQRNILPFLLKFIAQLPQHMDADDSDNFTWKVLISSETTKDKLTQSLACLSNPIPTLLSKNGSSYCSLIKRPIVIVPYVDVSMLVSLREYIGKTRPLLLIIGTANPIMKVQEDLWNFYYDMDTGELYSSHLPKNKLSLKKEWKVNSTNIKNALAKKPYHINPMARGFNYLTPGYRPVSLMSKFLSFLKVGQHDNDTVINTLKRVSILQILRVLQDLPHGADKEYFIERDDFVAAYYEKFMDFIVFPYFLHDSSRKFLYFFLSLQQNMDDLKLLLNDPTHGTEKLYNTISAVYDNLKDILVLSHHDKKQNRQILANVVINFPQLSINNFDILEQDFAEIDLVKFYNDVYSKDEMRGLSFIDKFAYSTAFPILSEFISMLEDKTKSGNPAYLSPSIHTSRTSKISRSNSFKNLLSINRNQSVFESGSPRIPRETNNSFTPSRNSISAESVNRNNENFRFGRSPVVEKRIDKIKTYIFTIFSDIEKCGPAGSLLVSNYLPSKVLSQFQRYKSHLSPQHTSATEKSRNSYSAVFLGIPPDLPDRMFLPTSPNLSFTSSNRASGDENGSEMAQHEIAAPIKGQDHQSTDRIVTARPKSAASAVADASNDGSTFFFDAAE